MSEISRFGVSVENDLLKSYDRLIGEQGYENRSEALRDLMREALVKARLKQFAPDDEVLGTLTLVYDHHANDLSDKMSEVQHRNFELVVSLLHVHVSHDDCMEVIVLRGAAKQIREMANSLLSLKGVKHGELFVTVTSAKIIAADGKQSHAHSHPHTHEHRH